MNIAVHVSLSDLVSSVCMPRSGIAYNQPFMHENFYFQDWEDAEILCIMRTRLTSEIPGKTWGSSFHTQVAFVPVQFHKDKKSS